MKLGKPSQQAPKPAVNEVAPPQPTVEAPPQEDSKAVNGERVWTCAPIQQLKMGRFQFKKTLLKLSNAKDIEDFEKLLNSQPERERSRVKTISLAVAKKIVEARIPTATKAFDSAAGRRDPTQAELIGTQELGSESKE